jgi:hypothetical protein
MVPWDHIKAISQPRQASELTINYSAASENFDPHRGLLPALNFLFYLPSANMDSFQKLEIKDDQEMESPTEPTAKQRPGSQPSTPKTPDTKERCTPSSKQPPREMYHLIAV